MVEIKGLFSLRHVSLMARFPRRVEERVGGSCQANRDEEVVSHHTNLLGRLGLLR